MRQMSSVLPIEQILPNIDLPYDDSARRCLLRHFALVRKIYILYIRTQIFNQSNVLLVVNMFFSAV